MEDPTATRALRPTLGILAAGPEGFKGIRPWEEAVLYHRSHVLRNRMATPCHGTWKLKRSFNALVWVNCLAYKPLELWRPPETLNQALSPQPSTCPSIRLCEVSRCGPWTPTHLPKPGMGNPVRLREPSCALCIQSCQKSGSSDHQSKSLAMPRPKPDSDSLHLAPLDLKTSPPMWVM